MDQILYLNKSQIIGETPYSTSQFYKWLKGVNDRKKREPKLIPEEVACSAVDVIREYPHFSGTKGQAYMIYHQIGYIPQHMYKTLKKIVKKIIFQEVSKRNLLPEKTSYDHERPDHPGEIWAEDITYIKVSGKKYYVALLIDVASNFYLGAAIRNRADKKLVEIPVIQALEINNNCGPKRFLLSDNGSQYVSDEHGTMLEKLNIVHKRIPACTPEYNGSCECGVKEFKNVFYNVLSDSKMNVEGADKEKNLLRHLELVLNESIKRMNYEIPRLCLKGVTPGDVQDDIAENKIANNIKYLEKEKQRKEVKPWSKKIWELVKDSLFDNGMSDQELMTKFCFFLKRPLRKLSNLSIEVSGN